MKPYSESCDQNKMAILSIIKPLIATKSVLEIGSGTGQHAVYFAQQMPHVKWYTSDQKQYHQGINAWLSEAHLSNIAAPFELDVTQQNWSDIQADAVFSANTVHIMNEIMVEALFSGIGKILSYKGDFLLYGPFNYQGHYTSESNQQFDQWLKQQNPESGIKDFEKIAELAEKAGLILITDYTMPANNRILHFRKNKNEALIN